MQGELKYWQSKNISFQEIGDFSCICANVSAINPKRNLLAYSHITHYRINISIPIYQLDGSPSPKLITKLNEPTDGVTVKAENHIKRVDVMAFSPDSNLMVAGGYGEHYNKDITIWDSSDLNNIKIVQKFGNNRNVFSCMAFTNNNQFLIYAYYNYNLQDSDRGLQVFDIGDLNSDPKFIKKINLPGKPAKSIAFSNNDLFIAVGDKNGYITILDFISGKPINNSKRHTGSVNCLAFSPGNQFIASGSEDETIKIWRVSDMKLIHTLQAYRPIKNIEFTDDDAIVSLDSFGVVHKWQPGSQPNIHPQYMLAQFPGDVLNHIATCLPDNKDFSNFGLAHSAFYKSSAKQLKNRINEYWRSVQFKDAAPVQIKPNQIPGGALIKFVPGRKILISINEKAISIYRPTSKSIHGQNIEQIASIVQSQAIGILPNRYYTPNQMARINDIVFSSTQGLMIVGGQAQHPHKPISIFGLSNSNKITYLQSLGDSNDIIYSMAISSNNKSLICYGENKSDRSRFIKLFERLDYKSPFKMVDLTPVPSNTIKGQNVTLDYRPSKGLTITICDNNGDIYTCPNNKNFQKFENLVTKGKAEIICSAFSPLGNLVAFVTKENIMHIWDIEDNKIVRIVNIKGLAVKNILWSSHQTIIFWNNSDVLEYFTLTG